MSYRGPISRDNEINVLFYRIYEFSQSCTTELHTPRIAWPFCTQTFKQCAPFKDILPRPRPVGRARFLQLPTHIRSFQK